MSRTETDLHGRAPDPQTRWAQTLTETATPSKRPAFQSVEGRSTEDLQEPTRVQGDPGALVFVQAGQWRSRLTVSRRGIPA